MRIWIAEFTERYQNLAEFECRETKLMYVGIEKVKNLLGNVIVPTRCYKQGHKDCYFEQMPFTSQAEAIDWLKSNVGEWREQVKKYEERMIANGLLDALPEK